MANDLTPTALRTPRSAGVAGILFAVLFVVVIVLIRKAVPANPREAGAWLTNASDRRDVDFAFGLVPFCGIFFLWFMAAIRSRIGEAEDRFFATVFIGSGLLFVAMLFAASVIMGGLIAVAAQHGGHPPADIWQFGRATAYSLASTYALRMAAVFTIASSTIALRLRIHARAIAVIGYVSAVLLLIVASTAPWIELVFPLWVTLVSVNLLVHAYRTESTAAR